MASVRGNINIQFLIELSSENVFRIYVDSCTRAHLRVRHASFVIHGYIVSRMGFCRAIAMIAKLNERNTFVVSNPARNVSPARGAAGLNKIARTPHAGSRNRTL
jgi:hypothetical protein